MSNTWSDLRPRVLSAIVLLAIVAASAWAGPFYFALFVAIATGVMIWELVSMHQPRFPMIAEILAATATALVFTTYPMVLGIFWVYPMAVSMIFAGVSALLVSRDQQFFAPYALAVMLTGNLIAGLYMAAPKGVLFLLGVVVVTDVAGYFAGKSIGGKKFWPKISPNKTWAGIIAGWIGAAIVGALAMDALGFGPVLIVVAVVMSFGSQIGDIAESALKRRAGVKDSSNLIPGHGGFMDRFDGVVGASMVLLAFLLLR